MNSDEEGQYSWAVNGKRIALDIARGLHFLHSKGVVHRWDSNFSYMTPFPAPLSTCMRGLHFLHSKGVVQHVRLTWPHSSGCDGLRGACAYTGARWASETGCLAVGYKTQAFQYYYGGASGGGAIPVSHQWTQWRLAVHGRDLKTSNILLTGEGIAKISDVGLATAMTAAETGSWDRTSGTCENPDGPLLISLRLVMLDR